MNHQAPWLKLLQWSGLIQDNIRPTSVSIADCQIPEIPAWKTLRCDRFVWLPVTSTLNAMKFSPIRSDSGRPLLTVREACYGLWGVAACFTLFGLDQWLHPPTPPFARRVSWLYTYAQANWGATGPALISFAFACPLFILGILCWRHASRQSKLDIRPDAKDDV